METATENRTDTIRHQRWGWLLFVATLVGIGFLFSQVHGVKEDSGKVSLAIVAERLDIGEQWETKEFRWTLPIKNTTGNDIHIGKFLSGCPCMTFDPPSLTLSAGQEVEVRITCDMTATCGQNRDLPIRDYAMPIAPADEKGEALQRPWVLYGKVRSAVQLGQRDINFGDSIVRGQPPAPRKITVTAHALVKHLEVTCDSDQATASLTRLPNDTLKYELVIKPRNDLKAGPVKFNVVLLPQTAAGPLPSRSLLVECRVLEDVQATPALIPFGPRLVGETVEETVTLRSWSSTKFDVERVECGSRDISVELVKAEPTVKEYRIVQRPSQAGDQSTVVRFLVCAKDGTSIEIPVQVRCLGIIDD